MHSVKNLSNLLSLTSIKGIVMNRFICCKIVCVIVLMPLFVVSQNNVACGLTSEQVICLDFIQESLDSGNDWLCNSGPNFSINYEIQVGEYFGDDVIILFEMNESDPGGGNIETSYYWEIYDCNGDLIEQCQTELAGNCADIIGSELELVEDITTIFDCEVDVLPDNCECFDQSLLCVSNFELTLTSTSSSIDISDILVNEDNDCNYSFSSVDDVEQLSFDCSDIGLNTTISVFSQESGSSCSTDIEIDNDDNFCTSCPVDIDSLLCLSWLIQLIEIDTNCTDPFPTGNSYRVFQTTHNGTPAILVDEAVSCQNPSSFGGGFNLYACNGDLISSCTYLSIGPTDCDNPPIGDPILGPAFSAATLIYDSTIDALPNCASPRPFITTWKTDNSGSSCSSCITVSTFPGETYDYDVDWDNDGVYDELGLSGNVIHDFQTPGTYTIAIRGVFPRIIFNEDAQKITNIDQWGDIIWSNMEDAFLGCFNLNSTALDSPNLDNVSSLSSMFSFAISFNGEIANWDVGNVSDMSLMFFGASSFNQNLESWDVSKVIDMSSMFFGASSFNQSLNNWNVSSVTNMFGMFNGASSFNEPIENWNVENVTNMSSMFSNATSFNQSLSEWNLMSATNLDGMLDNSNIDCTNYTETLQGWAANSNTPSGLTLGANGMEYDPSVSLARNDLLAKGWTIIGDLESSCLACDHPDYEALIELYNSTNGPDWSNSTGWREGADGDSCDPCNWNGGTWYGITCENNRVSEVNLSDNELTGSLPPVISLESLTSLDLSNNQNLSGQLPSFDENSSLFSLLLNGNNHSGSFPEYDLPVLETLDISDNNLDGPIPLLSSLPQLKYLLCFGNNISGNLDNLQQLSQLKEFFGFNNAFEGEIPDFSLSNLETMSISGNQLSGNLPPFLDLRLRSLYVDNNLLTGEIPDYGHMTELSLFIAADNDLSGCYPGLLYCSFGGLENLDFSNNPLLPYAGDYQMYCSSGGTQIGAFCGINQDNEIQEDCSCGEQECPQIEWVDLPQNISIDCSSVDQIDLSLAYTNFGIDECLFEGIAIADTNIVRNGCELVVQLMWSVEANGISLIADQEITIQNIPEPSWINLPPQDLIIDCVDADNFEDLLEYSNGLSGICEISGFSTATISTGEDSCQEQRILDWTVDDPCFPTLTYTQNIMIEGCDDFILENDFFSAITEEDNLINLLENDQITSTDIEISIIGDLAAMISDTTLTQDGDFRFAIISGFFDTLVIDYEVCDTICLECMQASLFITDSILEDIVPTSFISPNGDDKNDELRFTNEPEILDSEIWIFNRWGKLVFNQSNYTNDFRGEGLTDGVYYYVLNVRGTELKSSLTILR